MPTIGSLFTGYGGLDLAVEAVFGARTVWTSDIDPGARKIIAHRFPHTLNVGDITTVDWSLLKPVDILTGGWPCQPFSQAGKKKGAADERALWPEVARAVRALRPRYVVLENVSAIAAAGELARAVGDLAALGYVGSWRCVRASDVGAPHRRERIFIVATDARGEAGPLGARSRPAGPESSRGPRRRPGDGDHSTVGLLATPTASLAAGGRPQDSKGKRDLRLDLFPTPRARDGKGRDPNPRGADLNEAVALLPTPRATDGTKGGPNQRGSSGDLMLPSAVQLMPTPMTDPTAGNGHARHLSAEALQFGHYGAAIARWTPIMGRPAPDPTIPNRRGGRRLNPRFVEWMMGCPDGWVTDVPDLTIGQQLKALGNGVVPQQAAAAILAMIGDAS